MRLPVLHLGTLPETERIHIIAQCLTHDSLHAILCCTPCCCACTLASFMRLGAYSTSPRSSFVGPWAPSSKKRVFLASKLPIQ